MPMATDRILYMHGLKAKPQKTSDDSIRSYATWAVMFAYLWKKQNPLRR